ncbi:Nijmegen breakage syndrome 1 protein [Citrus sinensis]|uniref:Nijmegen breakage syndrome 1 protein n=1 Tax=Citrus sinensis TaxID=2711 RepID=A0ACB8JXE3_CITSI|nr:Nijmegen breakage syndrome 1 protein [Citrus sinensis]
MVWGLFPIDPLPGEDKYYIFSKGNYKVGRKGCDIIINKDKGVSRVHAEILVDEMISLNPFQDKSSKVSTTRVRIKDCSKYGTFINKNLGSKEKVHEFPNKEATLKDGDLVSFGTGNATYRFCYAPLILFVDSFQVNAPLQEKVSSIGAFITSKFCQECTHILVQHHMRVKGELLDAIVAKKPLVDVSWLEVVAEKSIRTDFPGCNSHVTTLIMEGDPVELANVDTLENCMRGYTFLLDSSMKSLLEVSGAKTLSIESFCPSSLVVLISSSCSTDETVVADSDAETEEETSPGHATSAVDNEEAPTYLSKEEISIDHAVNRSDNQHETGLRDGNSSIAYRSADIHRADRSEASHGADCGDGYNCTANRLEDSHCAGFRDGSNSIANRSEDGRGTGFRDGNNCMTTSREKADLERENSDIIYSQNLVVRDLNVASTISSTANNGVLNFKRFRKTNIQSGNSFSSLIPFSKYPYKDSDNGTEEMAVSMKEEKKRKQMEALAEDMFNSAKGKRRGVAGTIYGLLSRK